jgi:hypothetical protein
MGAKEASHKPVRLVTPQQDCVASDRHSGHPDKTETSKEAELEKETKGLRLNPTKEPLSHAWRDGEHGILGSLLDK